MIKTVKVLRAILLTTVGVCMGHIIALFIKGWGVPTEGIKSFIPYIHPLGIGLTATIWYNVADTFLKEKRRHEGLFVVVFVLPSGQYLIDMIKNKNGTHSVRFHTNLTLLIGQFKDIYRVAKSVDYKTFTTHHYGFNIMRPHIIAIPDGETIKWIETFRLKDDPTELEIDFLNHKAPYLEVSSELMRYSILNIVQSMKEAVFPEESKQNS